MKKLILIAFTALLFVGCDNHTETKKETKTDTFLCETAYVLTREDTINAMALAFAQQESNFDNSALSGCGRWAGCLQISEIMVKEANRLIGFDCFNNDDRYDEQGSYAIFKIVQESKNINLDIDIAIDIWNKYASKIYRDNIKKSFYNNLYISKEKENFFTI